MRRVLVSACVMLTTVAGGLVGIVSPAGSATGPGGEVRVQSRALEGWDDTFTGALRLGCRSGLAADGVHVSFSQDGTSPEREISTGPTCNGTLQRLGKLIPDGVAREWAYTGDRVPAERAHEVGFFNEVFADHDALIAGVLEIAGRIAAQSPLAIWGTKEAISYARDHSTADALHQIAGWQSGMFQPGDMMEAFAAKAEKRPGVFEDLPPRP